MGNRGQIDIKSNLIRPPIDSNKAALGHFIYNKSTYGSGEQWNREVS